MSDIKQLQGDLEKFAAERDWNKFHSPKNLAMALAGEVGELLEHFQWLTPEQSERSEISGESMLEIEEELADVMLYLLRLADKLNVDLIAVASKKIVKNSIKYPVEKSWGNAIKYSRRKD